MAARNVVAIHQPNFFPWLGYFNKIAHADVFVVLDNVQFQKTGGTWCNRVKMLVGNKPDWVTMPVSRSFHGVRTIREMEILDDGWRRKTVATIRSSYLKAPHFREVFDVIAPLVESAETNLAAYNLAVIRAIAGRIGLDVSKLVVGSTIAAEGAATDLLIAIVKAVGGTDYLYGGGSGGYQEDEKFAAAGVGLVKQSFSHPSYPQHGTTEFVPGLSIVDTLMNAGFEGTKTLVTASRPELPEVPSA